MKTFLSLLLLALLPVECLFAQAFNDFDLHPHDYYEGVSDDPMTRLIRRAESGEYDFGPETGLPLVRKLLADLKIPESSQILVFSQTSLQRGLIGPDNPRAMFFNEDTHLAWMPGGKVEIISFDPDRGGLFFLEVPPETPAEKITFTSPRSCFGCHGGSATNYLPGPLARSHFTSDKGRRLGAVQSHERIGHHIPFSERWGGYFVTGAPPTLEHLGNAFASRNERRELLIDTQSHRSLDSLAAYFEAAKYPRGDSNIVPLLLFDHQIEGHNLLMEARYRHRHLEFQTRTLGEPEKYIVTSGDAFFDKLVDYLLFKKEASLAGHVFARHPDFESDFLAGAKKTADGLSLKDLSLEGRLMQHRLSYLIQSRAFLDSPQAMKDRVYDRLWAILSPLTPPPGYEYFEPGERARIIRILRETHTDLPASWRDPRPGGL